MGTITRLKQQRILASSYHHQPTLIQNTMLQETTPSPWTETAHDWWSRSQQAKRLQQQTIKSDPKTPVEGAWNFVRGNSHLAFVDTVLQRVHSHQSLPVLEVRSPQAHGKTWTLLSLAARFVSATCPSKFRETFDASTTLSTDDPSAQLPQVILLDSSYDFSIPQLTHVVRSTLLRRLDDTDDFETIVQECLSRIHIARTSSLAGWVPLLETLRHDVQQLDGPTLVLWDGVLSEHGSEGGRHEVVRQLERFLTDCSVLLVLTTKWRRQQKYVERLVTHRIVLEENVAILPQGAQIPFQISLAGIVS